MNLTASNILEDFKNDGVVTALVGGDSEIRGIAPCEMAGAGDLVFVSDADLAETVSQKKPAVVVTSPELQEKFNTDAITLLISPNVRLAHALIKQRYFDRDLRDDGWPLHHPTAVIHESARLGHGIKIGAHSVIGRNVTIGDNVLVMAGSVIEEGSLIGAGSVIHPNVTIGHNSEIGESCIIKSGSVIGAEGFGFAQDEKRRSHRLPQTGRVVIEDRVVIGANCCIDRATYHETRIKSGTIMDNLCHIAHNVTIGKDCILTAALVVAGSTEIGDRVITSGQTGILDHLKITDDVTLLHRAGVTDNIKESGLYGGLPLQPLDKYLKNSAIFLKLSELRRTIIDLKKK